MKWLVLITLLLASCRTETIWCRHEWKAVYGQLVENYGKENVQAWKMENYDQSLFKYHMQVKFRTGSDARWLWIDCQPRQVLVDDTHHNPACKPDKRIK